MSVSLSLSLSVFCSVPSLCVSLNMDGQNRTSLGAAADCAVQLAAGILSKILTLYCACSSLGVSLFPPLQISFLSVIFCVLPFIDSPSPRSSIVCGTCFSQRIHCGSLLVLRASDFSRSRFAKVGLNEGNIICWHGPLHIMGSRTRLDYFEAWGNPRRARSHRGAESCS